MKNYLNIEKLQDYEVKSTTTAGIEAPRAQHVPPLWPVRQFRAAAKHNEPNGVTLHCLASILFLSLFLPWVKQKGL